MARVRYIQFLKLIDLYLDSVFMTLTIALSSSDASDAASCIQLFAFPKWKVQTVGKLKFWSKKRP